MPQYRTVEKSAYDEFTEKRSRFIGYVCPVTTVDGANAFINEIKQKHWDAKHNVYAYILNDGNVKKYSDDGEPQGTAGVPVLDVLEKEKLFDVCVVVTRYFGGILLGGGGLVRAYSHAAKLAVGAGHIVTMDLCSMMCVSCDYTISRKIASAVTDNGGTVDNIDYSDTVDISFHIPSDCTDSFCDLVFDLSNGRYRPQKTGEKYNIVTNKI